VTLRSRLHEFVVRLRAAGVRISVAESLDAIAAVAATGLERERLREALSASLIKDEADRATFDQEFARFFRAGLLRTPAARQGQSWQGMAGGHGQGQSGGGAPHPPRQPEPTAGLRPRAQPRTEDREAGKSGGPEQASTTDERAEHQAQLTSAMPGHLARHRAALSRPFATYNELDYEQAQQTLALLRRRFRLRLGRRLKHARQGRVDIRRTIRAAVSRGGTLIDLKWRARRPRHFDLLILGDVSGSVRYASALMLALIAGARDLFRRVNSFVFIDRLAEASFEQGHLVITPPLDLYARSDFGRALNELLATRRRLLTPATVIVILGDGRNNRRPPRADLLLQARRLCHTVLWLTPEARERWGTGDSAIAAYARVADRLIECRDLRALELGLERLAHPEALARRLPVRAAPA